MKTIHADKEIIYIWANKTAFIYNEKKFPFLQNIISHAVSGRSIHIIVHQLANLEQLDKSIKELNSKLLLANIKNIYIHQLEKLFSDQPKLIMLVSNILKDCKSSLANPIDLIKVMVGANLEKLNLKQALLADMDCIIPENIMLHAHSLNVFPLLDKARSFRKVCGTLDCYIENGFSLILDPKNALFNEILAEVSAKDLDYFHKNPNDAVYSIYVEKLIQHFTKSSEKNEHLMKKYRLFSDLEPSVKIELTQLEGIKYDRGASWHEKEKKVSNTMPLVFMAGAQPVYPLELNKLKNDILSCQLDDVRLLLEKLLKKGWDANEAFEWINELQKQENVLYYLIEHHSGAEGENLKTISDIIVFLMENGLNLDKKLLSFFMQTYRPTLERESFKVYAKVFADKYGLDYERMLLDIDHIPSGYRGLVLHLDWVYSQPELKTMNTPNSQKIPSTLVPSKPLFFKSINDQDSTCFSVKKLPISYHAKGLENSTV